MNSIKLSLNGLILAAVLHTPVYADTEGGSGKPRSRFEGLSIGLGVGYEKSPFRRWVEDESQALPFVSYESEKFSIDPTSISYTLLLNEADNFGYYFSLVGNINDGYKANDSLFFAGMDDRDDRAIEIGFNTGIFTPVGLFELSVVQDVADAHSGFLADLSYSLPLGDESAGFEFFPSIGVSYYSDDFNDYYYGVRSNEATAVRPSYRASGGVNPYIGLGVFYRFNNKWGLMADLHYEKLNRKIENSPLITEDSVTSAMFGITYSF